MGMPGKLAIEVETRLRWPIPVTRNRLRPAALLSSYFLSGVIFLGTGLSALAENWPCWRGPRLDGTSLETHLPVHWSTTSNLAWQVALPGVGHASPIVYGDRIFTVSAENELRLLLCLDRRSGQT